MIPFDERPSDSGEIARIKDQLKRILHRLAEVERQVRRSVDK